MDQSSNDSPFVWIVLFAVAMWWTLIKRLGVFRGFWTGLWCGIFTRLFVGTVRTRSSSGLLEKLLVFALIVAAVLFLVELLPGILSDDASTIPAIEEVRSQLFDSS